MHDEKICAHNTGDMSVPCQLVLEKFKKEIEREIELRLDSYDARFEILTKKIANNENRIDSLIKDKVDSSTMNEINIKVAKVEIKTDELAKTINGINTKLDKLVENYSEDSYENGELMATVQNLASQQMEFVNIIKELSDKIDKNKQLTFFEQIEKWMEGSKLRKLIVGATVIFTILTFFSAFAFYTGSGITAQEIFNIMKEVFK